MTPAFEEKTLSSVKVTVMNNISFSNQWVHVWIPPRPHNVCGR